MSEHGSSADGEVLINSSTDYSRTVVYKDGQLIFSKSKQETFSSKEDKTNSKNNFEKRNEDKCSAKVYDFRKGRFIKIKG